MFDHAFEGSTTHVHRRRSQKAMVAGVYALHGHMAMKRIAAFAAACMRGGAGVGGQCDGWAWGRRAAKPIRLRRRPGAPELARCASSDSGRADRAGSSSDASALAATSATRPPIALTPDPAISHFKDASL